MYYIILFLNIELNSLKIRRNIERLQKHIKQY